MTTTAPQYSEPPVGTDAEAIDVHAIRADFPILRQTVNGKPLIYMDNTATTQKPQAVIDALSDFYATRNANVHRGVHHLSVQATQAYEQARLKVRDFLGASRVEEIVYVRGTTEAINLVAQTYGRANIHAGDEVVISTMEHHSNIVPWQILCQQQGATLRVVPINDAGEFLFDEYEKLLGPRTKLVAVTHVSNAMGTVNPVERIIQRAHACGARVLIDGAQAVPHMKVDVRALDCDFYAFSGHKVFGPTGVGVLYGKFDVLDAMPPYQSGGDMIQTVSFEKTTYNDLPARFEAGTPNIAASIGLGAAIDYVTAIGLDRIARYERGLLHYTTEALSRIPEVRMIGTAADKASVVSFVVDGVHPHDVGTILDSEFGIAVRAGHHCAMPLMKRFNVPATVRASMAFYNTREEIDALAGAVKRVVEVFG